MWGFSVSLQYDRDHVGYVFSSVFRKSLKRENLTEADLITENINNTTLVKISANVMRSKRD